jgi:hypothetical protein
MNKFTKLANLDPARGLFRSNGSALKENVSAGFNGSFEVPVEAGEMTGRRSDLVI